MLQPNTYLNERFTVTGTITVTSAGVAYSAYSCTVAFHSVVTGDAADGEGEAYFRTSDLALIKVTLYRIPRDVWTTPVTLTLDPPLEELQFPLRADQMWSSTTTALWETGGNVSAGWTHTFDYRVTGQTTRTVHAGTFSAYNISKAFTGFSVWQYSDYSDAVGNVLTTPTYPGSYTNAQALELWSFSYGGGMVMTLLVVIVGVVVVAAAAILIVRARRKARAPAQASVQPPSEPQAGSAGPPEGVSASRPRLPP